jgi:hypothetical protein
MKLNPNITVKPENVERSCKANSHCCMVADAIRDRFPWATFIEVDIQTIRFNNRQDGKRYIYLTPPEVAKAIILFDQGVKVSPFSFKLQQAFMKVKTMRARHKKAVKRSREYKRNPEKRTPSFVREFGLRGINLDRVTAAR